MTVFNLGSINVDLVYAVPHILTAGETLAARGMTTGLGGKGTNMSVAVARAGAHVRHIGAVGPDGAWTVERLLEYGVDTRAIATVDQPTGQAIIAVADDGENTIITLAGANRAIPEEVMRAALSEARPGDRVLIQNETNLQTETARFAREMSLPVAYAAAPFQEASVAAILPYLDFLILNAVEADQLRQATGLAPADLPVANVVVTFGAEGAEWFDNAGRTSQRFPAHRVTPVDTTGAGDTVTGYILAGLDRGMVMAQAIGQAMRAGALMVTRPGAADVIPDLSEVQAMMQG